MLVSLLGLAPLKLVHDDDDDDDDDGDDDDDDNNNNNNNNNKSVQYNSVHFMFINVLSQQSDGQ